MNALPEQKIVLRIEAAAGADELRGSLTDERGTQVHFVGWLAFAAELQRARERASTHPGEFSPARRLP